MNILATTLHHFETEFPLSAAKCWRCDDSGAIRSASIVPRHTACVCETAGSEIEGRGFHKRVQQGRSA